jgi:hypothetical protein
MPSMMQDQETTSGEVIAPLVEMQKIIASESFAKAPRLSSFLAYIVEKSIERDVDSLTEQQIGIHVFNRAPGYNSNDDNIVRGTARSLRQRLATYYLTEGIHDTIRIEIPKGAYVAQFKEAGPAEIPYNLDDRLVPTGRPEASTQHTHVVRWELWAALAAVFAIAAVGSWPAIYAHFTHPQEKSALLWNTLFSGDKSTFIVPGDAGLNMYESLDKRAVDLNTYSQQTYAPNPTLSGDVGEILGSRYYTTVPDLLLVAKLVRLPQANPERIQIRFARDLAPRDLKDANLILLGTSSYNPWSQLFQPSLSLQMSWDATRDLFTVVNRTPQRGEQPIYQWTLKNGTQGGLTLISLTDNSQGSGRVLLIEGTTMGGVYAAADFLSNDRLLDPILQTAQRNDKTVRNFDVLLQSDFMRGGVSNLHVLAAHVH